MSQIHCTRFALLHILDGNSKSREALQKGSRSLNTIRSTTELPELKESERDPTYTILQQVAKKGRRGAQQEREREKRAPKLLLVSHSLPPPCIQERNTLFFIGRSRRRRRLKKSDIFINSDSYFERPRPAVRLAQLERLPLQHTRTWPARVSE